MYIKNIHKIFIEYLLSVLLSLYTHFRHIDSCISLASTLFSLAFHFQYSSAPARLLH
jgi:hypothetical protein